MSLSLIRGISGLEGSSDGVLLLLQEMVLVLCPWSQIVRLLPGVLSSIQEDQWLCLHTSLTVVLESFFFLFLFTGTRICY